MKSYRKELWLKRPTRVGFVNITRRAPLIGNTPMLGWIVEEKKLQPHIPVWDKSERDDGTFGPIGAPGGLEPRSPDSKPVCALQYSPEVPKPIGLFLIEKGADTVVWHATAPELS